MEDYQIKERKGKEERILSRIMYHSRPEVISQEEGLTW